MSLQIQSRRSLTASSRLVAVFFAVFAFLVQPLVSLNIPAAFAAGISVSPTTHTIQAGGKPTSDVNASGYQQLKLSFHYAANNLDAGDKLQYGWKTANDSAQLGFVNGKIESGANAATDETGDILNLALPSGLSNTSFKLYFENTGTTAGTGDEIVVNNVTVTGQEIPVPNATLSSTLPGVAITNVPIDFTSTITKLAGSADANIRVETTVDPAQAANMEFMYSDGSAYQAMPYVGGKYVYGSSAGFPLATATSPLRINFKAPGTYVSTARIINAVTGEMIGEPVVNTVTVTDPIIPVLSMPSNLKPSNNSFTKDANFSMTWNTVPNAVGYQYRTSNSLSGVALGSIIYCDGSVAVALDDGCGSAPYHVSPSNFTTNASTVTRGNNGTPEGTYYWQVRGIGANGLPGPWSAISKVTTDYTRPDASFVSPDDSNPLAGSVTVKVNASDSNGLGAYCLKIDGGSCVAGGYTYQPANGAMPNVVIDTTSLTDGTHALIARLTDRAGNAKEETRQIVVDNTAPAIATNITDGQHIRSTKTLTMTLTEDNPKIDNIRILDQNGQPVQVNGVNLGGYNGNNASTTYSYDFNTKQVADGTYKIQFSARDAAGNAATPVYVTVIVDNTPPQGIVTLVNNGDNTVTATIGSLSEQIQTPAGWSSVYTRIYSVNGPKSVTIADLAGNQTPLTFDVNSIDDDAPTVTITGVTPLGQGIFRIDGTVDDSLAKVWVAINGGVENQAQVNGTTWSLTTPFMTPDSYDVSVRGEDSFGNSFTTFGSYNFSTSTPIVNQGQVELDGAPRLNTPRVIAVRPTTNVPNITDNTTTDEEDGSVLGTSTTNNPAKTTTPPVEPSKDGWKVLGLVWYWWLAIAAALVALWWAIAAWRRRGENVA